MIEPRKTRAVFLDILDERLRQDERFGPTPDRNAKEPFRALSVLVEEVGEVARALNDFESPAALRAELIQVAAVAVAWIDGLDEATQHKSIA